MTHFTPVSAAGGGALIGLSAALLWLGNGRIAGISGIVGSFVIGFRDPAETDAAWRLAFLAGLVAASALAALALGRPPPVIVTSKPA